MFGSASAHLEPISAQAKHAVVRDIVMVGTLTRPRVRDLGLDWTTLRLLPRIARLFRGGDNHLLSGVLELVSEQGFRLVGAHEVAPALLLLRGGSGLSSPGRRMRPILRWGCGSSARSARSMWGRE